MYNGGTRNLAVNRNIDCDDCNGSGSHNIMPDCVSCEQCNGNNLGCLLCRGSGVVIAPEYRCFGCQGRKVVPDMFVLEVRIKPGMRHGQKIIYKQQGNQEPNHRIGDIIVVLEQMPHETFKRHGYDLLMILHLDTNEAIFGFEKTISTLDNRQLSIVVPQGTVTQNNTLRVIANEGMPLYTHPNLKGRLKIKFRVNAPVDAVGEIMVTF